MRPVKSTEAHHTSNFAELVCSNSLRGNILTKSPKKTEYQGRRLAQEQKLVPVTMVQINKANQFIFLFEHGKAPLAMKDIFLFLMKNREKAVYYQSKEELIPLYGVKEIELAESIKAFNGSDGFYFYDAAAPIVDKATIDMDKVYLKSRYDKGEAAYLNCPMTEEEFKAFHEALINAEVAELKSFEKEKYFEG
ncbi:hypothetical protein EfmAA290_10930 [Enterococcus faecium]|nr:hypothetical protein EfmAA290_10930 [Enterococcus faecium]